MDIAVQPKAAPWHWWQKILFRFFFIYIVCLVVPWWLNLVGFFYFITHYFDDAMDWLVQFTNTHLLHVKDVLVYPNGSGDTSYGWAQQWTWLLLALLGCIIWSLTDYKRKSYRRLNYWLCLLTRYYIAIVAFYYGADKIFLIQMPFPSQSQLATSLGDFLPMRLSWMFVGYSAPYEFFSGVMECLAGLLLLYRRTATLGVMVATGVFINVMMLNLCYDIPVKLFSMNLVFVCLFLLVNEWERIACFFVLNKPTSLCSLYHFKHENKWIRRTRIALKIGFIVLMLLTVYDIYQSSKDIPYLTKKEIKPIRNGVYDVAVYAVNKDTLPPLISDTMRWQDVIFDPGGAGSIKTADTAFRQRYRRAYFSFSTDTVRQQLQFRKFTTDSLPFFSLHYQLPDTNTIQLWGKKGNDSLYVKLVKSHRRFQLTERQFHWLSEANR